MVDITYLSDEKKVIGTREIQKMLVAYGYTATLGMCWPDEQVFVKTQDIETVEGKLHDLLNDFL